MKGVILYQSKYGATKRYVQWLVEELHFSCMEVKDADLDFVKSCDTIILAGGIYASGIAGFAFLKKNMPKLTVKKIAVLAVGASPYDEKALAEIREHNFKGQWSGIPLFYARGTWDEDAMGMKDKVLCGMLKKAVAKKDPATYEPWQKALMDAVSAGGSCDWVDQEYLSPLLSYIRE